MLFLQKPWQRQRSVKDISVDLAMPQHVAGSATMASFNASITPVSFDPLAVLTIGIIINASPLSIVSKIFLILFYCKTIQNVLLISVTSHLLKPETNPSNIRLDV
jgi:hypothetical protein